MKLSQWAKQVGLKYNTALALYHKGALPIKSEQLSTGTILVYEDSITDSQDAVIYARVSTGNQTTDLDNQVGRLRAYCASKGLVVRDEIRETGSGLNGRRPKLQKLLSDNSVSTIVVEHRDRLVRFGFEYIEAALRSSRRKVIVINQTEQKLDLVQDLVDVVTCFCAKIYGKRGAKAKAAKLIRTVDND